MKFNAKVENYILLTQQQLDLKLPQLVAGDVKVNETGHRSVRNNVRFIDRDPHWYTSKRSGVRKLQNADCRLQTANYGLQTPDRKLTSRHEQSASSPGAGLARANRECGA